MKKFVIQISLLVLVIFAALFFNTYYRNSGLVPQQGGGAVDGEIKVGETVVKVEVADSAAERRKGLGGRASLASDSGMLFIFEEEKIQTFWMKGMQFAIDFIWIRNGKVVDIIKNAQPPQPGQADSDLPYYVPREPVKSVLEVNSGFVDEHGIKIGDKVEVVSE